MPLDRDQTSQKSAAPDKKPARTHRELMRAMLLPMTEAPANDNDAGLAWATIAFFKRHLNWLLPTLGLAILSFVLLSISKH